MSNQQRPFAYLVKQKKDPKSPIHSRLACLPSNYLGMCSSCLRHYQKMPARSTCTDCGGIVRLVGGKQYPWRLIPSNIPNDVIPTSYIKVLRTAFVCRVCEYRYGSIAIFISLCLHNEHSLKLRRFTCRYCCPVNSPKVLAWLDAAIKERSNTTLKQSNVVGEEPLYNVPPSVLDIPFSGLDPLVSSRSAQRRTLRYIYEPMPGISDTSAARWPESEELLLEPVLEELPEDDDMDD